MRPLLKVVFSTLLFAAVHSLLASNSAKRTATRLLGPEKRDRYYRLFFNLQGVLTSGALILYILRLPDKPLWQMNRPLTFVGNLIRLGCVVGFIQAVRQIRFSRVSGFHSLLSAPGSVTREPEAQGPALDLPITGPFRYSRHPLNLLAIPLIWLSPRMTKNKLTFNSIATLYFIIGSWHEEARMRKAWGERYDKYRQRTRFMLGSIPCDNRTTKTPPEVPPILQRAGSLGGAPR
jgi:steroid 5-alpha reductase family enzyme